MILNIFPLSSTKKRIDFEICLILFGKRYYDPELGRWLTTNSVGAFAIAIPIMSKEFMFYKKINPFEGSVDEYVIIVDLQGNVTSVTEGNWFWELM